MFYETLYRKILFNILQKKRNRQGEGREGKRKKKKGKESSILEFHSGDLQCPGHTKGSALRSKFISITPTNS